MPVRPFLLCFALVSTSALCAVSAYAQPTRVGVRVGMTRSMFLGGEAHFLFTPEAGNYDWKQSIRTEGGFEAGVFLRRMIGKRLALQPEIGFAMRGGEQTFRTVGLGRTVVDYAFGYAQAAVLVRYVVRTEPSPSLAAPVIGLSAGPYVGVLATRQATVWRKFSSTGPPTTLRDIGAVRSLDAGVTLGADLSISSRLGTDLRLVFSVLDFVDESTLDDAARMRHSGLRHAAFVLSLYFLL